VKSGQTLNFAQGSGLPTSGPHEVPGNACQQTPVLDALKSRSALGGDELKGYVDGFPSPAGLFTTNCFGLHATFGPQPDPQSFGPACWVAPFFNFVDQKPVSAARSRWTLCTTRAGDTSLHEEGCRRTRKIRLSEPDGRDQLRQVVLGISVQYQTMKRISRFTLQAQKDPSIPSEKTALYDEPAQKRLLPGWRNTKVVNAE